MSDESILIRSGAEAPLILLLIPRPKGRGFYLKILNFRFVRHYLMQELAFLCVEGAEWIFVEFFGGDDFG